MVRKLKGCRPVIEKTLYLEIQKAFLIRGLISQKVGWHFSQKLNQKVRGPVCWEAHLSESLLVRKSEILLVRKLVRN